VSLHFFPVWRLHLSVNGFVDCDQLTCTSANML
jgi:hypothetical protein